MTPYYHASDHPVHTVRAGGWATPHWRVALVYGRIQAESNGKSTTFVYSVHVDRDHLRPDPKRPRAFVTDRECGLTLVSEVPLVAIPRRIRSRA